MMKIFSLLFAPIRWVLKFLLKIFLVLTLILVIVLACGNFWLPWVTTWQIRSLTGFNADIRSSEGSLFRGCVDFKNVLISNPTKQFKEPIFVSFNDFMLDVGVSSIFKETVVLENVIIDIDNITVVKNADGTYNYAVFLENISKSSEKNTSKEDTEKSKSDKNSAGSSKDKSGKHVAINKFVFAIRSVRTIDEKTGAKNEYSLKYKREFSNITDLSSLTSELVSDLSAYGLEALIQSTLHSITELPGIKQVKGGLSKVKNVSTEVIKGVGSGIKGIFSK